CIETGRINAKYRYIIEQHLWCVSEIDQQIAFLTALERLRVHRKAPFTTQRMPGGLIWLGVSATAFDGETLPFFVCYELDDYIVGDNAPWETIDFEYIAAKRFCRCGAGICGKRGHHCGDEPEASSAE